MLNFLPKFTMSLAAVLLSVTCLAETQYVKLSVETSDTYTVHVYNGLDEVFANTDQSKIPEGATLTINITAANDYYLTGVYVNKEGQYITNSAQMEFSYEVGSDDVSISATTSDVNYDSASGTSATSRYINSITIGDGSHSTTITGDGNSSTADVFCDRLSTVATLKRKHTNHAHGVGSW